MGVSQLPPHPLPITGTCPRSPGLAREDQSLRFPMGPLGMLCFPKADGGAGGTTGGGRAFCPVTGHHWEDPSSILFPIRCL